MTAKKVEVIALHCDQGMGNLIKIYDSVDANAKPTHLVLIDLGSEAPGKTLADKGLNEVFDTLKNEAANPTIDLLVVSHQDKDHWSLLPWLLSYIEADAALKTKFKIGALYYGGLLWTKGAKAALTRCAAYASNKTATSFAPRMTDFDGTNLTVATFKEIDGVKFHLLCANTVSQKRKAPVGIIRNTSSAVIALEFGKSFVIFPGDATSETIGWINEQIFAKWTAKGKAVPVEPCKVLSIPHHGALATISNDYKSNDAPSNLTKGALFSDYVKANYVVASAGFVLKFKHPYKSVLELLGKYVGFDVSGDPHYWVWYEATAADWTRKDKNLKGIFTTVIDFEKDGKKRIPTDVSNWWFTIDEHGNVTFQLGAKQAVAVPRGRRRERYPAMPQSPKR